MLSDAEWDDLVGPDDATDDYNRFEENQLVLDHEELGYPDEDDPNASADDLVGEGARDLGLED